MAHEDGVRRHLAEGGFTESADDGAAGFRVRYWDRGRVMVKHVLGFSTTDKPWDWKKRVIIDRLHLYAEHLEQTGYKVTTDDAGMQVIVADRTTREERNRR